MSNTNPPEFGGGAIPTEQGNKTKESDDDHKNHSILGYFATQLSCTDGTLPCNKGQIAKFHSRGCCEMSQCNPLAPRTRVGEAAKCVSSLTGNRLRDIFAEYNTARTPSVRKPLRSPHNLIIAGAHDWH